MQPRVSTAFHLTEKTYWNWNLKKKKNKISCKLKSTKQMIHAYELGLTKNV